MKLYRRSEAQAHMRLFYDARCNFKVFKICKKSSSVSFSLEISLGENSPLFKLSAEIFCAKMNFKKLHHLKQQLFVICYFMKCINAKKKCKIFTTKIYQQK